MTDERQTEVYVAVLTGGWIRQELASALVAMSHDARYKVHIYYSWDAPVSSNLARVALAFKESSADFLLKLDSDVWPYRNLLDLVERDLDVVNFPTPIWRPGTREPPVVINVTPLDDGQRTITMGDDVVMEIRRGGGSALLVARRVLEALERPFAFEFDEHGVKTADEDILFFDQVREAGFRVWAALSYLCGHVKEVDLVDVINSVKEWQADAVASE